MLELRQSTQVLAVIGPVVAVGDGFTPVTTLSLGTADEAELLKHDTSTVTDISGATFAAITSADGYYVLTLTTSHTDTLGMLTVAINDDSLCLPVKAQFKVITAHEWDRKYTSTGQRQLGLIATGTAQSATSTTVVLASAETFADDVLNGCTIIVHGSTQGYSQVRQITGYVGSTDTATVDAFTVTPSGTITYWIFATPPAVASGALPAVNVTQFGGTNGTFSGGIPAVNAAQVSGDATAADTLELFAEALDQSTGQLDSGSLAASAVTAIQSGLATAAALATVDGIVDDIVVDTADIQSRLPAALVNGRIDARVSQVHNSGFDSGTGTDVDPWIMTPI